MSRKAEELYKEALALSAEEREELKRLLSMQEDSLWASPEIEQAWMEEIDRRERDYRAGKTKMIPVEEAIRDAREHLRKMRAE
jgi:putative addiction module component (TIGR02574 family)